MGDARATQAAILVAATASADARDTQAALLAAVVASSDARATQEAALVAAIGSADARVTLAAAMVAAEASVDARVTQAAALVMAREAVITGTAVGSDPVILVQIELPAYGANPALTLYLATRAFVDKDGRPWTEAILEPPSIDYGGGFLETHYQPVACDFTVIDKWIPNADLSLSETFEDLLWKYEVVGARVWIRQAFTDIIPTGDYPTIFDGEATDWDDMDESLVPLHAVTKRGWNVIVPSGVVNEEDHPNAPISARGTTKPIFYGDGRSRRYLTHPTSPGIFEASDAGIARGAFPALIIDAPTAAGLELPEFLVSDRDIDGEPLDARWFLFESALGRLAGPGTATLSNPAGGPATLTLASQQTKVAVIPIEVTPGAVTPFDGMQEIIREDKPRTLAGVSQGDYDASKRIGEWSLPDIAALGTFISCDLYVWYAKNAWTGTMGHAGIYNAALVNNWSEAFVAGASPVYPSPDQWQQRKSFTIDPSVIAGWEDIKNCTIKVVLSDAGQEIQVHRAALRVTYQAAAKVETPGTRRQVRQGPYDIIGRRTDREDRWRLVEGTSADLLSFGHPIYWYGRGKLDTTGAITGTAGALIEHPADIIRHFLEDFCGVPTAEITTSMGEFGSFPDARSALNLYKMVILHTRAQSAERFLQQVGSESLCWFRRRGTQPNSPFVAIPWDVGAAVNYRTVDDPFTFARTTPWMRERSLTRFRTRISDVVNRLRINFDWDARTNTYGQQIYVTDTATRAYVGGFIDAYDTTDYTGRGAVAAASVARYGAREQTVNLQWIVDPETATDVMYRLFDLIVEPRVGIRFDTFVQAYDLECGHRIAVSDDWDPVMSFPRPGSDGSWGGKVFTVTNVKRPKDRPLLYEVEAVETTE